MDPQPHAVPPPARKVVWFDDGDLILKVVKDEEPRYHRVLSSYLKLHSEVFRDMLTLPKVEDQEMYQGCPVVQLHDEPQDVYRMLSMLFHPGAFHFKKLLQSTFDEVEAILLMADKYQMHDLITRLLPALEQDWPQHLYSWDDNEEEIKRIEDGILKDVERCDEYGQNYILDEIVPEPCRVIRLARKLNLHSILPSAYYHLYRLSLDREDNPPEYSILPGIQRRAAKKYLSGEDWITLHHGTVGMRNWCTENIYNAKQRLHICNACSQGFDLELATCLPSINPDPLNALKEYARTAVKNGKPCTECGWTVASFVDNTREALWTALPSIFKLPDSQIGWCARRSYVEDSY